MLAFTFRWCSVALVCVIAANTSAQSFHYLGYLYPNVSPSEATGSSADGSVIVGNSRNPEYFGQLPFRWTASSGMIALSDPRSGGGGAKVSGDGSTLLWGGAGPNFEFEAYIGSPTEFRTINTKTEWEPVDLSYDASVIVGSCDIQSKNQACRWSPSTGFERLGFLPTESVDQFSAATEVSADGNVIIGYSGDFAKQKLFRWTPQTGMMPLDALAPAQFWTRLSADGSTIVGLGHDGTISRWTEAGGTESLGIIGTAYGVSENGSRIVGVRTSGDERRPFIWDAALGVRILQDVLTNDYGLGPAIGDWEVTEAYGISDDGLTIVGQATRLGGGRYQAYAATVPLPIVPEPSAAILAFSCAFAICGGWRQKQTVK